MHQGWGFEHRGIHEGRFESDKQRRRPIAKRTSLSAQEHAAQASLSGPKVWHRHQNRKHWTASKEDGQCTS